MKEHNDPRIGNIIKNLVTGNDYQVHYKGFRYEGTLEGLEGNQLVLRACKRFGVPYQEDLIDRVEIPCRYSNRFNPL